MPNDTRISNDGRADPGRVVRLLAAAYPSAHIELDFRNALELTVATILSAQSTDKKINEVTPALFARYPTAAAYAGAARAELESMIHATGYFRNKASALINLGAALVERFDGEVPSTLDELVTLPGIGRKTANVVLGNAFDTPGVVVDTHVRRLAGRWGWSRDKDPAKVERAIGDLVDPAEWVALSQRATLHGRRVCHARRPACGACLLKADCPSFGDGPTEPVEAAALVAGPDAEHLVALADSGSLGRRETR